MRKRVLAMAVLWALLWLGAPAEPTRYYVRNRPVEGRVGAGEVYVPAADLCRYLEPAELQRVSLHSDTLRVDGTPVAADLSAGVPLVALTRALGFQVRPPNPLGGIDIVPPAALTASSQGAPMGGQDASKRSEYRMAAQRMERILQSMPEYPDPEGLARIERVGQKVARCSPLASIPWRFWLVDSSAPNAACVGEGHVFVTRGLLDLGLSDDELAGVLGHEIAHGVRRHPFRRVDLQRELMAILKDYPALREQVAEVESRPGYDESRLSPLRNRLDSYSRKVKDLQYQLDNEKLYSRQDESEADVQGMRYAVLAGYSADGLGHCLLKLRAAMVEQFGVGVLDEDMSHPPVSRRLEILQKARASWRL